MITRDQASALAEHLASVAGAELRGPDVWERDVLAALAWIASKTHLAPTWDPQTLRTSVSVTLPAIPGLWDRPRILLSPAAIADPVSHAATVAHECQHVHQLRGRYTDGIWPAPIAYVYLYGASKEARAAAEADAAGCDVAVRAWLTGEDPREIAAERLRTLEGDGYGHLEAGDLALGADILRSHAASVAAGITPPLRAARDARAWLVAAGVLS